MSISFTYIFTVCIYLEAVLLCRYTFWYGLMMNGRFHYEMLIIALLTILHSVSSGITTAIPILLCLQFTWFIFFWQHTFNSFVSVFKLYLADNIWLRLLFYKFFQSLTLNWNMQFIVNYINAVDLGLSFHYFLFTSCMCVCVCLFTLSPLFGFLYITKWFLEYHLSLAIDIFAISLLSNTLEFVLVITICRINCSCFT